MWFVFSDAITYLSHKKNQSPFQILGQIDVYLTVNPKRTNMIGSNVYAYDHGVMIYLIQFFATRSTTMMQVVHLVAKRN